MLSQFLSAAVNAVLSQPRSFRTPVPPNDFGATAPEFCDGKAIAIRETRFGSGLWKVEVSRRHKVSGIGYDGEVEGFSRPQTTAQVIAGLDRIFVPEKMPAKYIGLYQATMRPYLVHALPKPTPQREPNQP